MVAKLQFWRHLYPREVNSIAPINIINQKKLKKWKPSAQAKSLPSFGA